MSQNSSLKFYLFLAVLAVTLCGFSFFLGFRFQALQVKNSFEDELITKTLLSIENEAQEAPSQTINPSSPDMTNVYWIAIGTEPVCPPTHPIKGKVTNQVNNYYTPDNTFYNRVKPNLCFVSEVYAKDVAKFIKKF
jgi:hypothetical protein